MKWRQLVGHYAGTTAHKGLVTFFALRFSIRLVGRSIVHDLSKYRWDEARYFLPVARRLFETPYYSSLYKRQLSEIGLGLLRHYERSRHHPEHHPNGIQGMSLLDFVEMYLDWLAATQRHRHGDIVKSVEINQGRFGYSDDVKAILANEANGERQRPG
jgi:hypothetical protein